jgi:LuxR family maltose regulon positive regulatory protein
VALAEGDEPCAAALLADYLDRFGLLAGKAAPTQRRTLALWFVLAPPTRARWEAEALGPHWAQARSLAAAVVALRSGEPLPRDLTVPSPATVRALLPLPWAAELALGALAADRPGAWALVEELWPAARATVRAHRDDPGPRGRAARSVLTRLPVPPPARYELRLLGPVELLADGGPVDAPEWRRERVRSLLGHLAVLGPVGRERLADDLWPSLDADAQSRNLRVNLRHLLRLLEPDRAERDASFLVAPHGGGLRLHHGDWFDCDVWRFDDRCRRAREADRAGRAGAALALMAEAVELWRGEPTDLADDWAQSEVHRLRNDVVALARRASELAHTGGDHDTARRMGEALLRADPWSDVGHQLLVRALEAAGDPTGADRSRERHRRARRELGLDGDPLPGSGPAG